MTKSILFRSLVPLKYNRLLVTQICCQHNRNSNQLSSRAKTAELKSVQVHLQETPQFALTLTDYLDGIWRFWGTQEAASLVQLQVLFVGQLKLQGEACLVLTVVSHKKQTQDLLFLTQMANIRKRSRI